MVQQQPGVVFYQPPRVSFFCCDASLGLQILGWWWLCEVVIAFSFCWIPWYWALTIVVVIGYGGAFYYFLNMRKHKDSAESVKKLADMYKIFVLIGVTVGGVAALVFINAMWGVPIGFAIIYAVIGAAIDFAFRFYIYKVMLRYHEAKKLQA